MERLQKNAYEVAIKASILADFSVADLENPYPVTLMPSQLALVNCMALFP